MGKRGRRGLTPEERDALDTVLRSLRRNRGTPKPAAADTPSASDNEDTSSSHSDHGAANRDKEATSHRGRPRRRLQRTKDSSSDSDSRSDEESVRIPAFNVPSPIVLSDSSDSSSTSTAPGPSSSRSTRHPGRRRTKTISAPRRPVGRPATRPVSQAKARMEWIDVTQHVPRNPPVPLGAPQQLPIAGPCRIRKNPPVLADTDDTDPAAGAVSEICVSVTITAGGKDIEAEVLMPRLEYFLKHRCLAGLVSTERGFQEDNKHGQGIMKLLVVSASSLSHASCTLRVLIHRN